MLDRISSPSKARLRDCRRDVLCLAGARLLAEMPAPPDDDRFSVMQSITTLVAQSALSSSREAAWLDHVQDALKAISTRRKSQAIENAITIVSAALGSTTAEAAFPSFLVPDEELAVAVLGVLVAADNSHLDLARLACRSPFSSAFEDTGHDADLGRRWLNQYGSCRSALGRGRRRP